MSKKLTKFIDEAVENIRNDREVTKELLNDLIKIAAQSSQSHQQVSLSAAKYLETLQRSNEQLVKLAALVQKDEKKDTGFSFSPDDKDDIYGMIKKKDKEE